MRKVNCWEFKKCGMEKSRDCPAVKKAAGRICWMISGTRCDGLEHGNFLDKAPTCKKCDYYSYMNPDMIPGA